MSHKRKKVDKLGFVKFKNLGFLESCAKEIKRQAVDQGKKVFAKHIFDKESAVRI